jgi:hypothetical protein
MGLTVENIGPPIDGASIGAWVKAATIAVAEKVLREEVGRGFDNEPLVVTDGVSRRDYHDVKPFGRIEFIARPRMADAVMWALAEIQRRSPVLTGRYKAAHIVMLNGEQITTGNLALALRNVKDGDRVQIVNPQPYAKKIEARAGSRKRGITRQKGESSQAPAGVYQPVLSALVQRYGKSMFFDFKYVPLNLGLRYVRHGKGKRSKAGRAYVYPALQFYIKPGTAAPSIN